MDPRVSILTASPFEFYALRNLFKQSKYIVYFGICPPFLTIELLKPCDFLSDKSTKSIFCSNSWSLVPVPETQGS